MVPQDGHEKQDCETAAAQRWIESHAKFYASFGATLLGDDLYSRQPMCEKALAAGFNFIFVCTPTSYVTVYKWVDNLNKINEVSTHQVHCYHRGKKRTDTYRFVSDIPLRNSKDALPVNWRKLTTVDDEGETVYHNSWVTRHTVNSETCTKTGAAGRARWMIENNNNTLKTEC